MEKPEKQTGAEKTATDNQWTSTGLDRKDDERERRDGPGGEDADD